VTITEETEPEVTYRDRVVAEGLADLLPVPHILNDGDVPDLRGVAAAVQARQRFPQGAGAGVGRNPGGISSLPFSPCV